VITVPADSLALAPHCFARVERLTDDFGVLTVVRIFQAPFSFTDEWSNPAPAVPVVARVRAGSGVQNEVQDLTLDPRSRAQFTVQFSGLASALLSAETMTLSVLSAALNGIWSDGVTRFAVTNPRDNYFLIEFTGPLRNAARDLLVIDVQSNISVDTPEADLALTSPVIGLVLSALKQWSMMRLARRASSSNRM
jgi:hypothetical protein